METAKRRLKGKGKGKEKILKKKKKLADDKVKTERKESVKNLKCGYK